MDQFVKEVTTIVAPTQHVEPAPSLLIVSDAVRELCPSDLLIVGGGLVSPCFA